MYFLTNILSFFFPMELQKILLEQEETLNHLVDRVKEDDL